MLYLKMLISNSPLNRSKQGSALFWNREVLSPGEIYWGNSTRYRQTLFINAAS